jgi:similar to spore coat protein
MANQLGLHEQLELHELLTFKNNCLTKSATMSPLAKDADLKNILAMDVTQSKEEIQQLLQFIPQH